MVSHPRAWTCSSLAFSLSRVKAMPTDASASAWVTATGAIGARNQSSKHGAYERISGGYCRPVAARPSIVATPDTTVKCLVGNVPYRVMRESLRACCACWTMVSALNNPEVAPVHLGLNV